MLDSSNISFELNGNWSTEEKSKLIDKEVYNCLKMTPERQVKENFVLASEEIRQKNYEEILKATKEWRKEPLETHSYGGYSGPWMEHYFYMNFCCNRSISEFGGLIPVFLPWLDVKVLYPSRYEAVLKNVFSLFRDDCLYITVCQDDYGIEGSVGLEMIPWNLLILSGMGNGNVAIPVHTKRELPITNFTNEIRLSFVGSKASFSRAIILRNLLKIYPEFEIYKGKDWIEVVRKSVLNLAPRGRGVGTFRFFGLIELGAVPVSAWYLRQWLPYRGKLDYSKFSFIFNYAEYEKIAELAKTISIDQIDEMRKNVLSVRDEFFTPEGSMKQIEMFFKRGFSGSNLVCERHYNGFQDSSYHISISELKKLTA